MRLIGTSCVIALALASCVLAVWSSRPSDVDHPTEFKVSAPAYSLVDIKPDLQSVRAAELLRRPHKPSSEFRRDEHDLRSTYEEIVAGTEVLTSARRDLVESTSRRPETACQSIEIVPDEREGSFYVANRAHGATFALFSTRSGFGPWRMLSQNNDRGIETGSPSIDRVELVSLLLHEDPCVYILDETPTPALARIATRRPLDEFERRGLEAIRNGAELVWTREAPTRMFGAIRARVDCIDCHSHARENELLGAFTYYLDTPVDQLTRRNSWEQQ